MGKWEMVKLTAICDIQYGFAFDSKLFNKEHNGLPVIRIRDVLRGTSETYTTQDCPRQYVVSDGNLLVGMDGEFNIARWNGGKALLNQRVCKLTPRYQLSGTYLLYCMVNILKSIENQTSFVTVKHLSAKELNKVSLSLPPLDEQKRIAKNLDLASEIVKGYKEQLAELDKLVQSVFYEMFGDPVSNKKGWEVCRIEKTISGTASNGFFAKRDEYISNGNVYVLGVANIVNRMYSNVVGLPQTNVSDKDIGKYSVRYGDLLFCRSSLVAEGIGKASIVPKGAPKNILFECHVIRLHLNMKICVPEFIQVLTTTAYFRNQLISQSKTSTMTTISQSGILKSNIVLPPLPLQTRFASIVTAIEAQKAQVQQALTEAESLFHSLMQEYFE